MAYAHNITFVSVNEPDCLCRHKHFHCSYATSPAKPTKSRSTSHHQDQASYLVVTKEKVAGQKDALMDQPAQKPASSPQILGSHS